MSKRADLSTSDFTYLQDTQGARVGKFVAEKARGTRAKKPRGFMASVLRGVLGCALLVALGVALVYFIRGSF